jgi:hypothetical protein
VPLLGVVVELILPDGTDSFFPVVNNGGICPNAVANAGLCEARERVVWDIGELGTDTPVTVTSRPPVPNDAAGGTILTFDASATSADGTFVRAEAVAAVGF